MIYTIQVVKPRAWYYERLGEQFECVQAKKECNNKQVQNVFVVIAKDSPVRGITIPNMIKTIRESDAQIISVEEVPDMDPHHIVGTMLN